MFIRVGSETAAVIDKIDWLIIYFSYVSVMMCIKGIPKSTPFAWNWLVSISGVDLNIDLGMASSRLSSSLNYLNLTRHLTTSWWTFMTGTCLMSCSALLRCVVWDFYFIAFVTFPVTSTSLQVFSFNYLRWSAYFDGGTLISYFWTELIFELAKIIRIILGVHWYVLLIILYLCLYIYNNNVKYGSSNQIFIH